MREEALIGGVRISNPDKILYPEQGITKAALAEYYVGVADAMLPHILRRPLTIVRCPTGRQKKCFYQRHAGSGVPAQISEVKIPGFEDSGAYLYISDLKGLISLIQMGVLEIHPWGVSVDRPDRPDRVIFDLDPGEGLGFDSVVRGAFELREFLQHLGLETFLKTTGGKGLHLVAPIARRYEWPDVKRFARSGAEALARKAPERYLTKIAKADRRGRIFIDYLRNDPTSTAIAPYSTRARPGAPVATPLSWDELSERLDPAAFHIGSVPQRLKTLRRDPWAEISKSRQALPKAPELTR
jgi:bifunctional non-homologous end joining protein LigD